MRTPLSFAALAMALLTQGDCAKAQIAPLAYSAGVLVQAAATTSQLAGGTEITAGAHLAAGAAGGGSGVAQFNFSPTWDTAGVDLSWTVASAAYVQTSSSSGGSTYHELWSARPVTGRFVIVWTPTLTGTSSASFGFDLLDDGIVDASSSAVIPFTMPAGITRLRVHIATSANAGVISGPWGMQIHYQGTANALLSIHFEPTHCTVAPFGPACGSQSTIVGNLLGGVDITAHPAFGSDIAILVLGFDQAATPLPWSAGCSLHTTPIASLWRGLSGLSGAVDPSWTLAFPVGIGPLAFAAQTVAVDLALGVSTSSPGSWIICQ